MSEQTWPYHLYQSQALPTPSVMQRFCGLNDLMQHVCLLLADGRKSREIADQLGISNTRFLILRSRLLRKMGVETQIELSLRVARAGRTQLAKAIQNSTTANSPRQESLTILVTDTDRKRAHELGSAIQALGHRPQLAFDDEQLKQLLADTSFDVCLVSHRNRAEALPLLRSTLPLKDRPTIVLFSMRSITEPRLRDCGDTIAADLPFDFMTSHLRQVFAYCSFEDIELPTRTNDVTNRPFPTHAATASNVPVRPTNALIPSH